MKKQITIEISSDELDIFEDFLINELTKEEFEIRIMEMLIFFKKIAKKFEET